MLTKYNIGIIFVVDSFLIQGAVKIDLMWSNFFFLIELFDNDEFEFIYSMFFNEFCLLVY